MGASTKAEDVPLFNLVGGPGDGGAIAYDKEVLSWTNPHDATDYGFYVKTGDTYTWKTPNEYGAMKACPRCGQFGEFQPADGSFVNVSGVCLSCFGELAFGEKK